MQLSNPIESLASALHHAALVALPEFQYETRDWGSQDRNARKTVSRRPESCECSVAAMFPESWGSTALGFEGMGGAAVTPAYTVVIEGPGGDLAVYWSGQFAYLVPAASDGRKKFLQDVSSRRTASCRDAVTRYGLGTPAEGKQ